MSMTRRRVWLALVSLVIVLGAAERGQPETVAAPAAVKTPYAALAGRMESRLRFVTSVAFPGGPTFEVRVYDWIIGPRQEIRPFPLEGFATVEVMAGEVDTTIDGVAAVRREGEHFVVPEGATLGLRVRPETGRGDNLVSLHAVVLIRK